MEPLNEQCFIQTLLVNIVLIDLIHGGSMAFSCFFFYFIFILQCSTSERGPLPSFFEQAFIEFFNKTLDH